MVGTEETQTPDLYRVKIDSKGVNNWRNRQNRSGLGAESCGIGLFTVTLAVIWISAPHLPPDSSHFPTVETLEELSDVGAFVVLFPARQRRIKFCNSVCRGPSRFRRQT
jgi:hypothetical protein